MTTHVTAEKSAGRVSEIVREIEALLDNCHVVEDIDIAAQHEAVMVLVRSLSSESVSDGSKGVRVKPLEWRAGERVQYKEFDGVFHTADAVTGGYKIWAYVVRREPGLPLFYLAGGHLGGSAVRWFDTLDQAKAAAQADYDQRILRALDSGTGGQQPVAWRWPAGNGDWLYQSGKPVLIDDAQPLYSSSNSIVSCLLQPQNGANPGGSFWSISDPKA